VNVSRLALVHFADRVGVSFEAIVIFDIAVPIGRRQAHSDTIRTPYADHCIGDGEQKASTILEGSAPLVGALIGTGVEELIGEIAICSMHFYAIEAGL
jgi:hypothetical protein